MTSCTDVVAYIAVGAIFCPDCAAKWESRFSACGEAGFLFDPGWHDCGEKGPDGSPCHIVHETSEGEAGAVFRDSEGIHGATCGDCGACYVVDSWGSMEWSEAPCDASAYRWSRCDSCNGQLPWYQPSADTRLDAMRGELDCPSCRGACHF